MPLAPQSKGCLAEAFGQHVSGTDRAGDCTKWGTFEDQKRRFLWLPGRPELGVGHKGGRGLCSAGRVPEGSNWGGCRWGASCRVGGGLVCVLLAAYLGTWKKAQHIVDAQES